FIEMRQLMLLCLRSEAQLVDVVDDFSQVVSAGNLVLDLAEDFADLVFNGVRPARLLLESMQIGKELQINELSEVATGQGLVVIELAVLALGRSPALPAGVFVEDETVALPFQLGFVGFILLQPVEVLQKQQP